MSNRLPLVPMCAAECLVFSGVYPYAAMQYVIHYRINSACQLLKTGEVYGDRGMRGLRL